MKNNSGKYPKGWDEFKLSKSIEEVQSLQRSLDLME